MGQYWNQVGKHIVKYIDLYLHFPLCTLLLALKLFHAIDESTIQAGILAILLLFGISIIKDRESDERREKILARIQDTLATIGVKDRRIVWYVNRDYATIEMHKDIEVSARLIFVGILQQSLYSYLHSEMRSAEKKLPWHKIEVFFAGYEIAKMMQRSVPQIEFDNSLRKVRFDLAELFTDPKYKESISNNVAIEFRQYHKLIGYHGSMFSKPSKYERPIDVFYVEHSRGLGTSSPEGLIYRLESEERWEDKENIDTTRIQYYRDTYNDIVNSSNSLGTFSKSPWDESVYQWREYVNKSLVLKKSMNHLVNFSQIQHEEKALEIGAGIGIPSNILVDSVVSNYGTITLLDGSPQMLKSCRESFSNNKSVNFALCQLTNDMNANSDIDIVNKMYSLIVMHQSYGPCISSLSGVEGLIYWCKNRLLKGGRLVISMHNSDVIIDPPKGFDSWVDSFKDALIIEIRKHKYLRHYTKKGENQNKLSIQELANLFSEHGFSVRYETFLIDVSMEERYLLWRVPAIMNTIVDISDGRITDATRLLDDVWQKFKNMKTMPRTIVCWELTLLE